MWYASNMSEEGSLDKHRNLSSIGSSQEEVRGKQELKIQLDQAHEALMLAFSNKGEGQNKPNQKELEDLQNAAREIEKLKKELLVRPLTGEDKTKVRDWVMFVKIGLVSFLS